MYLFTVFESFCLKFRESGAKIPLVDPDYRESWFLEKSWSYRDLFPIPASCYHLDWKNPGEAQTKLFRLVQISRNSVVLYNVYFFGGLEYVGPFLYVAHFIFLRDVWIWTQSVAVASRRATNLGTHPSHSKFTYSI